MACGLFMIDNEQNNIYKMDSRKKINLTKIDKYLKVKKTTFYRSYNDRPCPST